MFLHSACSTYKDGEHTTSGEDDVDFLFVLIPALMGSSREEKLFRYVRDGRVKRVRSFLKKNALDLSFKNGQKRTVLHVACLLGEHAIVDVLLRHGTSRNAKDKDGNTPLHLALRYALQVLEKRVYDELIAPLLHPNPDVQHVPNNDGETPRQLIKRFKKELKRKWKERKLFEEEEEFKRDRARQRKEWNEKLFFEMGNDDIDFTCLTENFLESNLSNETYDEWADRIVKERHRKEYETKHKERTNTEQTRVQRESENREKTRILEEKHQKYLKDVSQKRTKLRLEEQKSNYELCCQTIFSRSVTNKLSFSEIPWPCNGTVEEMTDLISKWSCNEGEKKYLKEQQVRWHPDRFLQKCRDKLLDEDKEKILDYVKRLSQSINMLLEE